MRIGIIGAMKEEIAAIKQILTAPHCHTIGHFQFHHGQIHDMEIILLQSGIGKVNAAMGTALLIQSYIPDCIINIGTAAGFHPQLDFGDIIISTEVRHHDVDVTTFSYEYGQVPEMPPYFKPAAELVKIAEQVGKRNSPQTRYRKGLIASGDAFLHDQDRVREIREKLPSLCAAEMEAAAVAQACYQLSTPFVIIRSISDIAGENARDNFQQNLHTASQRAANFTLAMLEEIIHEQQYSG